MQSLETLLKRGFTDRCPSNELAVRFEEGALNIVRAFRAEVEKIRATYRDDIAPTKIKERAQAVLQELDSGPGGIVRLLGTQWATAQKRLESRSGLSPSIDAAQLSRESWIMDRLSAMSSSEQIATLRRAIDAGDTATLKAALHAPPALRIIHLDPRVIEEVRTTWYRQTCPEAVAEYEGLTVAHQCERANYDSAVAAIKEIGGIEADLRERLEAAHPTAQAATT